MRRAAVALIVAILCAGGCGVPTDSGVEVADRDDVPFGLLDADRAPATGPPQGVGSVVDIFLYDPAAGHLVPVTRRVESSGPSAVIAELESGPSEAEATLGLQSALSEIDAIDGLRVDGTRVTVDLTETFTELSGTEQRIALAQLVFSLTDRTEVEELGVTVEDAPVEVPRGDGTLTGDPVGRSDYEALAPP